MFCAGSVPCPGCAEWCGKAGCGQLDLQLICCLGEEQGPSARALQRAWRLLLLLCIQHKAFILLCYQ